MLLSVAFVPLMLRSFGMELYGVLSITWMIFGHLGWMDLGFSAACTKFVAGSLANLRHDEAASWAWTSVGAQLALGTLGGLGLWLSAPPLVDLLQVQADQRELAVLTLRLFALGIPLDLVGRSMTAVLEAAQRFDWTNALNLFGAAWTYAVYSVGILRDGDFQLVIYGLVALKLLHLVAAYWAACKVLPALRRIDLAAVLNWSRVSEMGRFGGWVSVNTAIGPAISFFDRWVISALRGVAYLPLYTVPANLVTQLSFLPGSLAATLFPAFSAMKAQGEWERAEMYFVRAHKFLLIGLAPLLFVLFIWAPELLRLWIDADFSAQAATPLRILLVGLSIGLLAPISNALLQGAGRPDLLSRVYLVELPLNVVMIWFLVRNYGIAGAAAGYSIRAIVETTVLWIIIHRTFPWSWRNGLGLAFRQMALVCVALIVMGYFLSGARIGSYMSVTATLLVLSAYSLIAHFFLLTERDRSLLRGMLRRVEA
jgi:O-antigen/teichoic acid export membrane protein